MYDTKNYFDNGYDDGYNNIGDEAKEDRIDEIAAKDGWLKASDYEDGYDEGYEDRDYEDKYDHDCDSGYDNSDCGDYGGYDDSSDDWGDY